MVHPLVLATAASAGVGAVVAFELAVFRPWRDENWPHGFAHGVRNEFFKLRQEVEQAVNEIQRDFRTRRDERRRGDDGHTRLNDDELDDFRRGVGEEASSERSQHEFEMHEREASAYRDQLRASMMQASGSNPHHSSDGLRRRRRSTADGASGVAQDENATTTAVDEVRVTASPELPHHKLGNASPSIGDTASLADAGDSRFNSVRGRAIKAEPREALAEDVAENDAAKNGLLGLDFRQPDTPPSLDPAPSEPHQDSAPSQRDPFADIVDDTASSWHAVFDNRSAALSRRNTDDEVSVIEYPSVRGHSSEEGHVELDTNGLSQTLSEQHLGAPRHDGMSSVGSSPCRSNRALAEPSEGSGAGSRSDRSEPDFEVISDTAESEARWSHLDAPPSPTISSASEALNVTVRREAALSPAHSDAGDSDSWAELSEPGSDTEAPVGARMQSGSLTRLA